ncbi:hypothetical protein ABMA27_001988 [Loxostege sticticalis]|uniref:BTB domain-containing protein n=1 Tax=Loxostege sticticalis TaxID=481309 RepID=A0ABR3HW61_LOXSC
MTSPQFSLTCDTFKTNIFNGLSSLQQREEFVDMTLAADGHFVKVHQIIVSLASPYLRELILSAPCPHPVVFLNKISHRILCSILEYIYTGEVMVSRDSLPELIAAGKELRIKGLQDMDVLQDSVNENRVEQTNKSTLLGKLHQNKSLITHKGDLSNPNHNNLGAIEVSLDEDMYDPLFKDDEDHVINDDDVDDDTSGLQTLQHSATKPNQDAISLTLARLQNTSATTSDLNPKTVQYTLSNQGSLQMILNRFVYFLRYCHKNSDPPVRLWRCVDYIRNRCPASVTTKDDVVIQRVSAHKHGFHDKKIMKKIKDGTIFTAIKDAEDKGGEKKTKI